MDCSVKEEVANEIKVEPVDQDEESPINAMNPYINAVHAMNPFNNALHAINPFNTAVNPFNNMNPLDFIKDEKDRSNVGMVNEETDTAPSEIVPEVSLGTTCSICLKTFSDNSSLKRHFRKHTGEKPYKCEQCSKSFSQSGSLKMHLRTHTGEKPYSCTICTKSFSQNKDLIIHLRRHTGERPYPCIYCQRAFSDYGSRKRHLKTHTEGNVEREKPFLCSQCPKSFAMIEYLNIHFRVHTGEKPYSCDKCPKTFANKGNLNKHLETHDVKGEKSYLCYNCAKSFSLERYLKQHFLSVHKGEQFYPSLKYSKLYVQANKSDQNYIRHEDGDMGENEKGNKNKGKSDQNYIRHEDGDMGENEEGNTNKGIEGEKGIESTATASKGKPQISENIQIDKNYNSSEVDPISINNQSDEIEIKKSLKNNETKEDEREKTPDRIVGDLINDHHELIDNSSNNSTLDPTSKYENTKKQSLIVQQPYNNKSTKDKYERRPYNKSTEDEYERRAYDSSMSNYDIINEDQIQSSEHMESPHKIFGNNLISKASSEKSTEDEYESTSYDASMSNYNKINQDQVQSSQHMESPHKNIGNQFISKSDSDKTNEDAFGRNINDGSLGNYSKTNDDEVQMSTYMETTHKKFIHQSFRKSGFDNPTEDEYERITYDGLMGSYNKINEDQVQMARYMESPHKKFGYQSISKFNSDKSPEDEYQRTAYDGSSGNYKTFSENQDQNLRHMASAHQSTSKYDNNSHVLSDHEELFDDMGNNTDARIDNNTKGKESVNNFRNDADVKPYLCSYCPESFTQHVYLLQHHLQEHKEQKWQI